MTLLPLLAAALLASSPPPQDEEVPRFEPAAHVARAAPPPTTELRTPRFRLMHTAGAAGAARVLAKEVEGVRDEIRAALGRDWPGTTEVRLGLGREEFDALALSRPPSWAVALAWPDQNVMLVDARSLATGEGQTTLRHEMVHVALGRLGTNWPRWFQEGLAQSLTGERQYRFSQYSTLAQAVGSGRVIHLDDLAQGFPDRPADVEVAYAESVAFVEFLRERHAPAQFGQLIDEVGTGAPFERAFAHAFHTSLSQEERIFLDELPHRYPWWPLLFGGGTALWGVASMLVVAAWLRRRQAMAVWHQRMAEVEAREDAALRLLATVSVAANDDVVVDADEPDLPWLVTITRQAGEGE